MTNPRNSIHCTICILFLSLSGLLFHKLSAEGTAASATNVTAPSPAPTPEVDPIVKASAYGDKTIWSYAAKDPLPWTMFHPNDFGSLKVSFDPKGVRSVGEVPAPGVHPRIFFSPEDLPAIRKRIKEDEGAQEAWKNILAWSHTLNLTYDEKAEYAQPDWSKGNAGVHGRFGELMRIGGYDPKREDYYALLAEGKMPKFFEKGSPTEFFRPGAAEAFRCLIDDDAKGAQKLAAATVTAVKLEQERRAKTDKSVKPGEPPKPSTPTGHACSLGYIYDFIYNWMTPEQKKIVHDELVTLSAWADNYGTFNNAEGSRSNWATFSDCAFALMAIEGEPGFNDLKFRGLYRGWRNFYNYSFFKSGAAYEGEGKLLFGLDAVVAFDRVAKKYGLEPLTQHPLPRAYYSDFSSRAMLPTRDGFAVFDILGGIKGGFTTPQDLIIAKYLYPDDKTIDFVYRALVGDDYSSLPHNLHFLAHQEIISAIFATAYDPKLEPEKLNLPLSFFCGQRAVSMTRSGWDTNAVFLTMHVRGVSGGHPYRDRNGIMLTGKGRPWITIPGHGGEVDGRLCNTVLIDGADQSNTTPGRVVDFVDKPLATFTVGDTKYCWDWIWARANRTLDGKPTTHADIEKGNIQVGQAWKIVEQNFNDFAYTKLDQGVYQSPLKYIPDWLGPDGLYSATIRQVNTPVLKSFRTAGVVRGPHPYALIVDDIQRNCLPARYELNLNLGTSLTPLKAPLPGILSGDIVMTATNSIDTNGVLTPGEPALLIRMLQAKGDPQPPVFKEINKQNILTLSTKAESPDFKLLLYPFKGGEPLPQTKWNAINTDLEINFPDQKDSIAFTPASSGKTDFTIKRDGKEIVAVNAPVPKLNDPDSDRLTEELNKLPEKVAALKGFDVEKVPGLIASWSFDKAVDGFYPADQTNIPGIPDRYQSTNSMVEPGVVGNAVNVSSNGLVVPFDLKPLNDKEVTVSFWVKSNTKPWMGDVINAGAFSLDLVQGGMHFLAMRKNEPLSSSNLTGWTQYTVTIDSKSVTLYCNGTPQVTIPVTGKTSFRDSFKLGGGGYGGFTGSFDDLRIYNKALDADTVQKLYLHELRGLK